MLTDEKRAEIRKAIEEHKAWEATPEGVASLRAEREFHDAVSDFIVRHGGVSAARALAALMPDSMRRAIVEAHKTWVPIWDRKKQDGKE